MMKKIKEKKQHMGSMCTLLLFAVFALCMLSVLLTGAGVYKRLVERNQAAYDGRTLEQYLISRVHHSDCAGAVTVSSFTGETGGDTLFLTENIEGEPYVTRIYVHDGYVRELFSSPYAELAPEDGEKVLAAEALTFSYDADHRLLQAEVTAKGGKTTQLWIYLRSGEEAAP